ncbi:hypothetical protein EDB81DRAFT_899128 [Dactylonectria macrodidyma]|uniref:Uncharacterized protein n=1 Tax=Dactylonectria macrodidyma TaxID=307937 RepID=A0A9P9EQK3_9HYPO|nr:hypothetical protein EDB81DRAFT_899128 [Dactylonectria macrodidyma]
MSHEYISPILRKASVRCFNVPGAQETLAVHGHLSNAVFVPAGAGVVHVTGQVGNLESGEVPSDCQNEYRQAFENVQTVLRAAGIEEGWEAVYKVHFLSTDLSSERLQEWLKNIQTYCKDSRPTQMAVGVTAIGWPGATLEIYVEAVKIV